MNWYFSKANLCIKMIYTDISQFPATHLPVFQPQDLFQPHGGPVDAQKGHWAAESKQILPAPKPIAPRQSFCTRKYIFKLSASCIMDGHFSPTLWGSTWLYVTLSSVCGRIDVKQKNTRDSWLTSMTLHSFDLTGWGQANLWPACRTNYYKMWGFATSTMGVNYERPWAHKKNGGHPHGQKTPTNSLAGSIQNHNKQLLRWRSKVLRTSFANTNQLPNTPSHFPTKHGGGSFELIFHPSLEVQYPYQTGPTSTTKSVNDTDVNAVWMRSGSWGQPGKHFFWISCPCYGWFLLEYVGNTASIKHRFIKETEPKTCARHQSRSTSVNKMMIHIYDVSPGEERADWQEWDLHR